MTRVELAAASHMLREKVAQPSHASSDNKDEKRLSYFRRASNMATGSNSSPLRASSITAGGDRRQSSKGTTQPIEEEKSLPPLPKCLVGI